ncbi:thiol reductant ABC exporter subunit CydD [Salinicola avicenniae]|uniref:thiol reductant ABC exporter subunit CydD n=1 Tax=Salinicola avicenniae TaxID=2916836 RepID=UPI002072B993|nr:MULTISPECIES: thiol reductant ABC exporter subunit CydD [unclassified Salinicola]
MALPGAPTHGGSARRHEQWLKSRARAVRGTLSLTAFSGLLGGLLLIVQCWLVARVIDAVIIDGAGLEQVWRWLWPLLGVFGLRAIVGMVSDRLAFEAASRIKRTLRERVMASIAARGPRWMERQRSGEIANALGTAVEGVHDYVAAYLPQKQLAALIPLAILVVLFPHDWVSGLILLITAPILPLFMIIVGRGAEALSQKQWRRLALLGAHVFDAIEGLTTLKQFGASKREAEAVARLSEDYRSATMTVLRVAFLSSLVLEFFATLGVAMVAVYIGFRLYYGQLDFLPGLFALLLAPEFYRPLRDMGANYHARMAAIGAVGALMPVLESSDREADPATDTADGQTAGRPSGQPLPSTPVERIRFDRVSFRHDLRDGGNAGVHEVELSLARGECVALAGPSGAGKTTLGKLLLGFLDPAAGRIWVDEAPLDTLDGAAWHARLGWMPQRATLFAGSVRDNLTLGAPDATPADIDTALTAADALDIVQKLPDGLDTWLGDGGSGLSGGQIQRLALARSLVAKPEVLVLDEPTAALDAETATRVLDGLQTIRAQVATLLITHDIACARRADRVLFVDRGRIVEQGSPAELAAAGGDFARFVALASGEIA